MTRENFLATGEGTISYPAAAFMETNERFTHGHSSPVDGYTAELIALNFFAISTCSYLRPMPGVLWPVIASEIRSGTIAVE
jgi:hypothetical protein